MCAGTMYSGNHALNRWRTALILVLVWGSLAWRRVGGPRRGAGRGRSRGGRRARSVGRGNEDGIEGAGPGAPGDGDVVSGGFAKAVQLFGDGGVGCLDGGGLGERVGQGQPGGQAAFDVDVGDQSGAGDAGDAHGGGTLGHQPGLQAAQARALGPRPGGRGGQGAYRCGGFVDDDVVAIPVEFVVAGSAFDLDVESGHRRMIAGPVSEKLWRQAVIRARRAWRGEPVGGSRRLSACRVSSVRASAIAVWNAPCRVWLRTSPMNTAPPGASSSMALSMTSARYPALGKYWTTELRMMVSK